MLVLLPGLALALCLAGCGAREPNAKVPEDGDPYTLKRGNGGDPGSLDLAPRDAGGSSPSQSKPYANPSSLPLSVSRAVNAVERRSETTSQLISE